jgi:hypothetical protein
MAPDQLTEAPRLVLCVATLKFFIVLEQGACIFSFTLTPVPNRLKAVLFPGTFSEQ